MAPKNSKIIANKLSSISIILMLALVSYSITLTNVSAVGSNQNDIGTSGGDLPDNLSSPTSIPNLIFSNSITGTGDLVQGTDDFDYLRVSLAANEGIAVELSFNSVDDFDLAVFDSNFMLIDDSFMLNPEQVTTNGSTHGGMVYIEIYGAYFGGVVASGSYTITIWKFTSSTTNPTTQNDLGQPNYDLPDSGTALQSDPNFPLPLNGAAPLYSGIDYAELDLNGDNDDWLSFTLDANEGFAFQITYPTTSTNGTTTYNNEFDLTMFDVNMNLIDQSIANNPEYVTTNNTVTIPGGNPHGGTIYIHIYRYAGFGTYDLEFWTWSTSSTGGGGGGSNGSAVPSPCTGNSAVPDILEPNDDMTMATLASILPIYCTGLTADIDAAGVQNEDYYEVEMISGVTYYFNLTFTHINGDIDARLEDSFGTTLSFNNFGYMSSSTDNEAGEYTATSNFTAYFVVYHYSSFGSTGVISNVYDVEISTDNPGGGQSLSYIDVTMNSLTNVTIEMTGLTVGDTYEYDYYTFVEYTDNGTSISQPAVGPYTFTATSTTETVNYTIPASEIEGDYWVGANLFDATGSLIHFSEDSIYQEVVVAETTSSTTGDIFASNITVGNQYTVYWFVFNLDMYVDALNANPSLTFEDALNVSRIDEDSFNFTSTSTSDSWQVTWASPTTMDVHGFYATIFNQGAVVNGTGDGALGSHFVDLYLNYHQP